ncbi:MAG: glycosyltransferase family 2 protein, partial [Bradyrhizobium sp.]
EDDRLLRAALKAGCPTVAGAGYDLTRPDGRAQNVCGADATAWMGALQQALAGGPGTVSAPWPSTDWPQLIRDLLAAGRRAPPGQPVRPRSASVGVLHHGRHYLRRALESIPADVGHAKTEIVVIDNASTQPLRDSIPDPVAPRVLRFDTAVTQSAAYNHFASEAAGDIVIFLDDDNTFASDGIRRLLRAFETGWFDIVVSTLDLVDGDPSTDPTAGRFIFIGDAGLAGLFFNGFGDTAMAVRRSAFLRVGGFRDQGHTNSGLDWEFLARAKVAGLAIGVLHEPAIRYARRIGTEHREWRKNDAEGMRRMIAAAYGTALDAPLLARLAQGLQLSGD